jgi:sugar (pentulose or hexulose) kinase
MPSPLRHVAPESIITGFDFSTGSVKGLAFDLDGATLAEIRLPTDLWTEGGVSELNLMQLEGQVHAAVRLMAERLRELGRLDDWAAIGISATHHTAGRIDDQHAQVRRAICWNDQTLAEHHARRGLARLGGMDRVRELIGGPWAIRYSLSHLVKDEVTLPKSDRERTRWMIQHGSLVAGFMTGRFDVVSVSAAASTGIMDLRTARWQLAMLAAVESPEFRRLAERQLPNIIDMNEPVGPLSESLALEARLGANRPLVFPTSDDQQAGLVGGGAVDTGQLAVILGNSAVVNGSADQLPPAESSLDAMRLNWGPYLWMRCYNNGAQFLDRVIGPKPNWPELEKAARAVPPGCDGTGVLPFAFPEPSRGVTHAHVEWSPGEPNQLGIRYRAALEALAYLIALGVREHEEAGQRVTRISVSGGISRSDLMCEILASVLDHPLERLVSDEGPALGAAATALAAVETQRRREESDREPYSVADAVARMVRFRDAVQPRSEWTSAYRAGLNQFEKEIRSAINRRP